MNNIFVGFWFLFIFIFFWGGCKEINIYILFLICIYVLILFFVIIKKILIGMKWFGLFFREKFID